MGYTPVTPFRRMMDSVLLKHQISAETNGSEQGVNKWEALKDLTAARDAFGLSDRVLGVLRALISFHPGDTFKPSSPSLVVFPSNKTLSERLHGMPSSTLRRHIAQLVDAGVILRRDSPNGKRYTRRIGGEKSAFGFDLTPLVTRFGEIQEAAQQAREDATQAKQRREAISLMKRDLIGLADIGRVERPDLPLWDEMSALASHVAKILRRKALPEDYPETEHLIKRLIEQAKAALKAQNTAVLSVTGAQNECHYQKSNIESFESESDDSVEAKTNGLRKPEKRPPHSTDANLVDVLDTCQEIQAFTTTRVRTWTDLIDLAEVVRPMMGIVRSTWETAKAKMGTRQATIVLAAMLERLSHIRSPGAYLQSLAKKAAENAFDCGPMLKSLRQHRVC